MSTLKLCSLTFFLLLSGLLSLIIGAANISWSEVISTLFQGGEFDFIRDCR